MSKGSESVPTPDEVADSIIRGMQEKKGESIVKIDLREVHSVSDIFIICHGNSDTQVGAITKGIEEQTLKDLGERAWRVEGLENAQWVLLDHINVVAHVFHKDARGFYDIEGLWADANIQEIEYEQ